MNADLNTQLAFMQEKQLGEFEQMTNSLNLLCAGIREQGLYGGQGQQLSQTTTIFENLRWYMISNQRSLLSQLYVEHGIVQTLVDQPVDDAFRAGYEIKTEQLSKDNLNALKNYAERIQLDAVNKQAIKWGRLYGGGAVLIITDQDPRTPLRLQDIKADSRLEFRSADMWELYFESQNTQATMYPGGALGVGNSEWYNYYTLPVHRSRVFQVLGKEAPAFIRPRLRGWGMSELEKLVRSLNQYLKNQDVIFELLDEAKIDVYRIKGFNTALMTKDGTAGVQARVQLGNEVKNFQNAIVMDSQDEYQQKQLTFAGLGEMLLQIRQGIAADLKMPMTKLFGISSAGFSSGEDDIENYNSMIEGEIRSKNKFIVVNTLGIICQKLFGFIPDDLMIEWNPLRILNAKEEEEVKDSQFNRVMAAYSAGLMSAEQACQAINKDSLIAIPIDELKEGLPPVPGEFTVEGSAKGTGGKQAKAEA